MPEEVLFESESTQDRAAIASYLREVAEKLESGGAITLSAGGQSITMDPPATAAFEVKAEREGPTEGNGELSIEFEIEWKEGASEAAGGDLSIE
ncbi:amphi-Trp domain-containing protein [Halobellus rubicundus]|uniref:Amphi-Trp domain-containing protein n=1 Tax=Halobellus rubicundus TaxID=2996466 RepID=A0ABD5MC90_9EURY